MLFSSYKYDNIRNFYFLLIVLIGTLCGCSPDNEENITDGGMLFSLLDYGQLQIKMDSQGMDIYNDSYLFQGSYVGESGCGIVVADLVNKEIIGCIDFLKGTSPIHMNNINCGRKYKPEDRFPILYISEANNEKRCFVTRLSNNASQYSILQVIKYTGEKYASYNYMDWFLDNDEDYIYGYGLLNSSVSDYCIIKFPLPPLTQESVILTDDDIIDDFLIRTDVFIPQGTKMRNGILHTVYGYNTDKYPSWYLKYDLVNKKMVSKVKLDKRWGEPEAVSFFQDKTIISNNATNPSYWIINE